MVAAKAFFSVTAGVLPGSAMSEYSRRWDYSSVDFEADRKILQSEPTKFSKCLDEAHDYAKSISNPAYVNWVKVEFLWV